MQPVEVIGHFNKEGTITPYRFKMDNHVIKIERVQTFNIDMFSGNILNVYDCKVVINELEKVIQLKYEIKTCRWYLTRI